MKEKKKIKNKSGSKKNISTINAQENGINNNFDDGIVRRCEN